MSSKVAARSWIDQVGAIAERGREILGRVEGSRSLREIRWACLRLIRQRGEASSLALAADIAKYIQRAGEAETLRFLEMLASDLGPDAEVLSRAVLAWSQDRSAEHLAVLFAAVEPPRQELFRRVNMVPGGTRALVGLRETLLRLLPQNPDLVSVEADLKHLFTSWFNRGFLQLEQITWSSPADILESLISHETVHIITGWDDLEQRLASDRRCFAFFHPALPREPLIFVEVALTRGLVSVIEPLIDPARETGLAETANTAIFYSINNCQPGLRGITFGSFLIKQVMGQLAVQLPRIRTFATLSPMPQFATALSEPNGEFTNTRLERLLGRSMQDFKAFLANTEGRLRPPAKALELVALAYLLRARSGRRARDPVAHFHLSNGARIEHLAAGSNASSAGRQSHGVMVNYKYDLAALELNHERYIEQGIVSTAPALRGAVSRINDVWKKP